jgi:PhnO protein
MAEMIQIRRAEKSDVRSVKALIDELEKWDSEMTIFASIYEEYLKQPYTLMYLVDHPNDGVVAFISCKGQQLLHHLGWVYEIQELIVTDAHRGKGYGRLLVDKIREEVEMRGAKSLEVTSNKRRLEAHAFYGAIGFRNSHEKFTIYF